MAEQISLAHLEKKAERINRDFELDIEIDRLSGSYRAVVNKQSRNLTPLTTKRELWHMLDCFEEGLELGIKIARERNKLKLQGCITGRTASDKPNYTETERRHMQDGRPRTESDGQ